MEGELQNTVHLPQAGNMTQGFSPGKMKDEMTGGGWSRRAFLKLTGFTVAGLAACQRAPVEKAIPYLVQPEEVTPGKALWYASTCGGCSAGCGVLVKTREGRPVKLEGNAEHPVTRGGLCAVGQASLLELYDSRRLRHPVREGQEAAWEEVDAEILAKLADIRSRGGAVRFLTGTVTSPTLRDTIRRFLDGFSDGRHVTYDPLSSSAILEAHQRTHGIRALPRYRFDQAEVIAGFDADFLGTWIAPVEFTAGYRAGRDLEAAPPRFSYHVQFESRLSLTGGKADRRVCVAPGELGAVMTRLAAWIAAKAGAKGAAWATPELPVDDGAIHDLAERLWQARGRSLVVCGSQDIDTQALCNYINHLLDNYGHTVDLAYPSYQRQGDDRTLETLLQELRGGQVGALFVAGVNPVYDLPRGEELAAALKRVPLSVSFAGRMDETADAARFVCPDHHPLESWGDAEATAGVISLFQPAIRPLGNTRSMLESLSVWMGAPRSARETLQRYWETHIFPEQTEVSAFQTFWDRSVHDGFAQIQKQPLHPQPFDEDAVRPISAAWQPPDGRYALVLYPKVGMRDGRHAHNPWLQELPDPVSKVAWDNYACVSPAAAGRLGVQEGDVVRLADASGRYIELPVHVQPGQHDRVVAVALGYGCKGTDRFARVGPDWLFARPTVTPGSPVGRNAAPFLTLRDGLLRYTDGEATLTKTGRKELLAGTQEYHTLNVPSHLAPPEATVRPVIRKTTLAAFQDDPAAGVHTHPEMEDLWPEDHVYTGHHWGMVIDLTACTGCSACMIACQAENNVPVVGKDEMRRHREMHWIRIDRYYDETREGVEVDVQPMLCQQCDHAPCETVCPVLATVHSKEGLNEQIYNRCVGTRYCANNCPYKARRFNWFDYPREDRLQNMALNPDVTVRSRGVMEKCTFCVQRIQEARIEARRRDGRIADGDIQPACQQSCPAQAIVFGDTNDPESRVSRLMRSPRRYRVLEEINVRPSVGYLMLVRNQPEQEGRERHG